jgi:hypothetical protein
MASCRRRVLYLQGDFKMDKNAIVTVGKVVYPYNDFRNVLQEVEKLDDFLAYESEVTLHDISI